MVENLDDLDLDDLDILQENDSLSRPVRVFERVESGILIIHLARRFGSQYRNSIIGDEYWTDGKFIYGSNKSPRVVLGKVNVFPNGQRTFYVDSVGK